MKDSGKQTHIDEEAFIVEHSGEIPEVAFHSSLYYLAEDPEGPGLELNGADILPLKQAVVKRYREIILRDLEPKNRDKKMYRGLARCGVNWQRLLTFCSKEKMDHAALRQETAAALQKFLQQELVDVESGRRAASINCSIRDIEKLAASLGLSSQRLPDGWQMLCSGKE